MEQEFHWKCHGEAEAALEVGLENSLNLWLKEFSKRLEKETSTRLLDWLSYLTLAEPPPGYVEEAKGVFYHPGAHLPRVVLGNKPHLGLVVEDISLFLSQNRLTAKIEGTPLSPLRTAELPGFTVIERRGTRELKPIQETPEQLLKHLLWKEKFKSRDRTLPPEQLIPLALEMGRDLGAGRAASIVLEVEREFWEGRNRAGQIQKRRQDNLGMGWANNDHHTFRSSRKHFAALVQFFEALGFNVRERFYAGEEAGWGAQIMEQKEAFLVLFLDVDLAPHEIVSDFAHTPLPEKEELGTIGLWCALHGDSIQESGMHHLEAQFLFDQLRHDLTQEGVEMMAPFSNFDFLKQAFTKGEHWKVSSERLQKLLQEGKITEQQAHKFEKDGALGSHLENLQRREGYKGFNQKNVSSIIKRTDPRGQA
jgi:hypothetical protein